jgi:hypothetical protein
LKFESNSRLDRIEACGFFGCFSLKSICLPSSFAIIGESFFYGRQSLSLETFGSGRKDSSLACFTLGHALSILIFKSDRKLDRIGTDAFFGC